MSNPLRQFKAHSAACQHPIRVLSLGEALFDRLPSGRRLGGAPLNTAVHCHQLLDGFNRSCAIATAVGNDALGRQLLDETKQRGLETDLIQQTNAAPTGVVDVSFTDGGDPIYEIATDSAWDHLALTPALTLAAVNAHAVCFGSLAQRRERTRETVHALLETAADAFKLYDVNLRPGLDAEELVRPSLRLANAAKLGSDELPDVLSMLGMETAGSIDAQAFSLLQAFDLACVIITRGADGTFLYLDEEPPVCVPGASAPFDPASDADPVGAGDSVGAACIVGVLLGQTPAAIAGWANAIGAHVAGCPGATPPLPQALTAAASFSVA